jgi:nucleotide-binding universal stress UspA family protein
VRMKSKTSIKPDSAAPASPPPAARPLSPGSARSLPAFKQILVPIDFSECSSSALDYGLALGQKFGTRLTLLYVVEPAIYPENYLLAAATLDETNQNLLAGGRERLEPFKQRVNAAGLSVETLVRMGRAQSEICDTAKAIGSDIIVMGTHGGIGQQPDLLGGTAERVLRQAPCPVLTVRQQSS